MHKRAIFRLDEGVQDPEINLTALIDVVFVVLIMFILVAPLLELERIQLAQAPRHDKTESSPVHEMSPLHIHVREDNSLLLNGRALVFQQFQEQIKRAYEKNPLAIPQLYQDKRATFGTYQSVKNCLEEAGFKELEIILSPQ
ncbi:MAG: hypothetical protein A2Y28_03940 [Chlamydiae bacterium GWC2_50_10]|nr:MAG: hypothetical protein A2Z85_02050 [Chlamydiae bacterium GWA2_50_15]OGN54401.1 MAG: hypothetical protein A2098_04945 [Chlamydiae bacterium GWF2_49_8]OGN54706.1 MAG: hypothetical protein A2Y28_03940 [Chlamydiae bacterium GWC2_50_10]OGN58079.1 MAG: hypothetical protein A3D18_03125 [Chlamydiae bacterium RIFCSPHIGHO2_02_FULL_49_29]OGN62927.1 MAG: hypothetical protein A3E26_01990 [Chlamydiae bacterium RIFCSPHIGHO2_12_FULL_49_32]OGN72148.1 MAG: hypothetical protein A3I15_01790 [Chlamydiae bact